jgi:hypothetical protein
MHEEGKLCCMVWKYKQAVVHLSTHAEPISLSNPRLFIHQRIRFKKKKVHIKTMHLQYIQNMRGVDTANQLHVVYLYLTQSHKWWHYFFLSVRYNGLQYVDYTW